MSILCSGARACRDLSAISRKCLYADMDFKDGELVLKDPMLVGAQHPLNKLSISVLNHQVLGARYVKEVEDLLNKSAVWRKSFPNETKGDSYGIVNRVVSSSPGPLRCSCISGTKWLGSIHYDWFNETLYGTMKRSISMHNCGIKECRLRTSLVESESVLTQEPGLIIGTILDNIVYRKNASEDEVRKAYKKVSPTETKDSSGCVVAPNKSQQQPMKAYIGDGYCSPMNKAHPKTEGGGSSVMCRVSCARTSLTEKGPYMGSSRNHLRKGREKILNRSLERDEANGVVEPEIKVHELHAMECGGACNGERIRGGAFNRRVTPVRWQHSGSSQDAEVVAFTETNPNNPFGKSKEDQVGLSTQPCMMQPQATDNIPALQTPFDISGVENSKSSLNHDSTGIS
ncbi:hypothetical protein JHK82_034983 [Glycine max]|nr:hypothetical protein JHK85_035698 [Glycine max]KAG5111714.1 hypothetical protein JHK82_034983 [Glycine max]KAG5128897.1 hypothetical protein JHK84_035294 [Glycine max]